MRTRLLILLAAATAALALSCDQRPADPALPTNEIAWNTVVPIRSDARTFNSRIWGSSSTDIYVGQVASKSRENLMALSHYDGNTWEIVPLSFGNGVQLPDIWGSGPDDVYVASGNLNHFDGTNWSVVLEANLVSGSSGTQVYAANDTMLFTSNGAEFDTVRSFAREIYSLDAAPDGSVFVGLRGQLMLWNGTTWQDTAFLGCFIPNICAFAWNDAFAGRDCFTDKVYHWDGTAWSVQAALGNPVADIEGNGSGDMLAVGWDGTVHRYDGISWQLLERPTGQQLSSISAMSDGFAVAARTDKVLWLDAQGWRVLRETKWIGAAENIYAESPTSFVLTDGESIYRYDDNTWTELPIQYGRSPGALSGRSLDDFYAVADGRLIEHFNGETWDTVDSLAWNQYAIWASPGGPVFSVGDESAYRLTGSEWEQILSGEFHLNIVVSDGANGIVAGGETPVGRNLVKHFDGAQWQDLPLAPKEYVTALWAGPGFDVWAATNSGFFHWDGNQFNKIPGPPSIYARLLFGFDDGRVLGLSIGNVAVCRDGFVTSSRTVGAYGAFQTPDGTIIGDTGRAISWWRP
jgi:hypothetical protein